METVKILNVPFDNITMLDLLARLKSGGVVFTPNVDHLVKLQKDEEFCRAYGAATYKTCDSQIIMFAARFLGMPLKEKISGSDLLPAFYRYYAGDEDVRIFLLGAAEGVAEKARQAINRKVGREIVVGAHSPSFGFEKNPEECQYLIDLVEASGANVLALGVGAPKQEKWIAQYKDHFKTVTTFLAIGATIDFEAGNVKRSPKWITNLGCEWVYRLLSEPQRLWKRYLVDDMVPIISLVLQQKLGLYQPPYEIPTYDAQSEVQAKPLAPQH
ncbi:MAG: WecB/TagA/CpsF family glycosyltransferase [Synechococcales cyanobacterium T60_A2020_003]|nr:WecB/TagA/CpsF family glycosyltransferase [Synechococcales cyanobacterium T60_A2020_003]